MTRDDDDVKRLLGKAFGPEPPLTLDREEIFRRGRRGVRIRRFATSGGVAAAVAAVVLGAAALSNLPGDGPGQVISPAQGTTTEQPPSSVTTSPETAPRGPQLPLTTVPPPSLAVAVSDVHAAELTKVLSRSGVVPGVFKAFPAEPSTVPLTFKISGASYRATAALSDAKGQGILIIMVGPATRDAAAPRCPNVPECAEVYQAGVAMAERTAQSGSGSIEYSINALRSDGTSLILIATNLASIRPDETRTTRAVPPVGLDQLRAIATMPGFTFG